MEIAGNSPGNPTAQEALLKRLLSPQAFQLADHAMRFLATQRCWLIPFSISAIWASVTDQTALEGLIESQVSKHGRWLLITLLWAVSAFRPVLADEIDIVLTLDDGGADENSKPVEESPVPARQHGPGRAAPN